ncbi:MAG: YdcF family protein [Mariprofundaceae bacterium]
MELLAAKSLSQLLLPPGGLILLAVAGLIFWRKWWGRGLVGLSLALFYLLSTEPVRDVLLNPLETAHPPLQANALPAGKLAIVLLGGGIYEKAPEYGGRDSLGQYALMRTVYAAELAKQTALPVHATGGAPLTEDAEPEGRIMRRWLLKLGVPANLAHAEVVANNTWENAGYIKALLDKQGIRRIILVTSAWHMPRAVWCFRVHGLDVIAAPCAYLVERESYDLRSFLPRWNVLDDSGHALHEYLGVLWYHIRYG